MLCASWELYCESVLIEALDKLLEYKENPDTFPDAVQMQLKTAVHGDNAAKSRALELAGDGWKKVLRDAAVDKVGRFNTPKPENIDKLFRQFLGVKDLSSSWAGGAEEVESFVVLRGDIAHNGVEAEKVNRDSATHLKAVISKVVTETDDALYAFLREETGKAPWQKTAK